MIRFRRLRPFLALLAIASALVLVAADANARAGGGSNSGSRGSRTYTPPAATNTAPKGTQPFERSATQPGRPSAAAPAPASTGFGGGLFSRPGLLGGLAAGFIGAGLFGMLFGHGMLGNLGGLSSIIGLVFQIGLIALIAYFGWRWWQRRNAPAYAAAAGPAPTGTHEMSGQSFPHGSTPDVGGSRPFGLGGQPTAPAGTPIELQAADFDAFERMLGEIQAAYAAEDLNALRARATPEMVGYFSDDLAQNTSRGVVTRISGVKLEQGDLSEAWREGDAEYATVSMRFSLIESTVERTTGRLVEGDPNKRIEVTEQWTFMRQHGGTWLLSAIQQTD